jgi:hypothetical protein
VRRRRIKSKIHSGYLNLLVGFRLVIILREYQIAVTEYDLETHIRSLMLMVQCI